MIEAWKVLSRFGTAVLHGLVICGTCGERMSVRYRAHHNQSVPTYCCGRGLLQRGESGMCQTVHGGVLDRAISEIVIEAMTPLAIEVELTVQQELATRHEEAGWLRRQHMERPRYCSPFWKVRWPGFVIQRRSPFSLWKSFLGPDSPPSGNPTTESGPAAISQTHEEELVARLVIGILLSSEITSSGTCFAGFFSIFCRLRLTIWAIS